MNTNTNTNTIHNDIHIDIYIYIHIHIHMAAMTTDWVVETNQLTDWQTSKQAVAIVKSAVYHCADTCEQRHQ